MRFTDCGADDVRDDVETATGRELWKSKLPASARSTPMTYVHRGKQYVVISSGGHDPKIAPLSDKVVAFALE